MIYDNNERIFQEFGWLFCVYLFWAALPVFIYFYFFYLFSVRKTRKCVTSLRRTRVLPSARRTTFKSSYMYEKAIGILMERLRTGHLRRICILEQQNGGDENSEDAALSGEQVSVLNWDILKAFYDVEMGVVCNLVITGSAVLGLTHSVAGKSQELSAFKYWTFIDLPECKNCVLSFIGCWNRKAGLPEWRRNKVKEIWFLNRSQGIKLIWKMWRKSKIYFVEIDILDILQGKEFIAMDYGVLFHSEKLRASTKTRLDFIRYRTIGSKMNKLRL